MCRVHTHIPSSFVISLALLSKISLNISFASATLSYSGFFLSWTIFYRLADWSFHVTFIFSCKLFVSFCYFHCDDNFVPKLKTESFWEISLTFSQRWVELSSAYEWKYLLKRTFQMQCSVKKTSRTSFFESSPPPPSCFVIKWFFINQHLSTLSFIMLWRLAFYFLNAYVNKINFCSEDNFVSGEQKETPLGTPFQDEKFKMRTFFCLRIKQSGATQPFVWRSKVFVTRFLENDILGRV